jgi:O-antigen/teichoic acid export membrane protein
VGSLKPKLLYQLAVSFLYSAAPIIIFPYVSRVLGPEQIGKINFIDYTAQFFILFASFGLNFYGVREIARIRDDRESLARVGSELVLIHILTTIASLVIFGFLSFFRPEEFTEQALVVLAVVNIATSAFGLEWMIHGLEDFSFLAKRSFIIKILSLAAVFIFVRETSDYVWYYAILIMSNIVLLIVDLQYVRSLKLTLPPKAQLVRHFRPLSVFFLTTVSLSIYTFFDTVILGFIAGSLAVGLYTTALKIIRLAHNLISDLGGVLLPRVSYLVETGNHEEVRRIINKSFHYVLTITIPLGFFLFLAAEEIMLVLGGEGFAGSVPVLQILSLLPLLIGLTNIFFIQVLLPFGREKTMLTGVLAGSVVSLAANLILCPMFGERGAAMSCIAAELSVAIFLGIAASKEVRLSITGKQLAGIFLSSLLFLPLVMGIRFFTGSLFLTVLLSGLLCLLVFTLMQVYIFRNTIVIEIIQFFTGKWKGLGKNARDEQG